MGSAKVPDGMLAVVTVRDLSPDGKLFVADFLDMQALACRGHLLGVDGSGDVRFGMRPLSMVDGVWFMREDVRSQRGNENLRAALTDLSMESIE